MKLEDIKKQNIHKVPEKYFEDLPQIIQSKVANSKHEPNRLYLGLKYALPALALVFLVVYFGLFNTNTQESPEEMLAAISTEDLVAYLENTDITTEEILEQIDLETIEGIEFEQETEIVNGLNEGDLDQLFNEYKNSEDIF